MKTTAILNKRRGSLEIYPERVEFRPFPDQEAAPHKNADSGGDVVKIPFKEVRQQLVNAATSAKALMILTTGDGDSEVKHRFQFTNGASAEEERQTRDRFKDVIALHINAARTGAEPPAISSSATTATQVGLKIDMDELKARRGILSSDANLRKLHRELVLAGHLTEEEFWEGREELFWSVREEKLQSRGLDNRLMNDLKPASSEGNEVKFVLTPEIIRSIFLHHPRIKRAYEELVKGGKMNDTEFWTRCLQSAFFYRDRQTNKLKDPIFDKAAVEEEEEFSKPMSLADRRGARKPRSVLSDLTAEVGMDGYSGLAPDVSMKSSNAGPAGSLIRRLNRHGELVLNEQESQHGTTSTNDHRQILRSVIALEELQPRHAPEPEQLHLRSQDAYQLDDGRGDDKHQDNMDVDSDYQAVFLLMKKEMATVRATNIETVDEEACERAIQHLLDACSSADSNWTPPTAILPADTYNELLTVHMNAVEVLKHFWMCIPVDGDAIRKTKAKRMLGVLAVVQERLEHLLKSCGPANSEEHKTMTETMGSIRKAVQHAMAQPIL